MKKYGIIKYCPSLETAIGEIIRLFGLLLISIVLERKNKTNEIAQALISRIEKFDKKNLSDLSFSYRKQWQLHQLFSALGILIKGLGNNKINGDEFYEDKAQMISHLSHIVYQIQKGGF